MPASIGVHSILCVDSDENFRALLEDTLRDDRLVFAPNAFDAIRHINAGAYHGYILEYWLPDWSGAGLCREIRKLDPHGPIVFCTAAARDNDRGRALRAGANAFLTKPVDPDELRAKLRTFMTLSEIESLHAKVEEERAVQNELERRLSAALGQVDHAHALVAASVERTARTKAYKAFIEARGTRAHFESWWPQVFQSVRANREA